MFRLVAHRVHAEWLQKPFVCFCLSDAVVVQESNGGASYDACMVQCGMQAENSIVRRAVRDAPQAPKLQQRGVG